MGKYIMNFETHSQYEEYMGGGDVALPNVSYCKDNDEVHYNPYVHDYSQDYLTFITLTDGTYRFSGSTTANTLSYSIDDGETWTQLGRNANTPTITSGTKVLWKGTCSPNANGIGRFYSTARFDAEGNTMSLLYGDEFSSQTTLGIRAHYRLFSGNTNIVSAENMILPATSANGSSYISMFEGCSSLTSAPQILATHIGTSGCSYMFYNCTSLTKVQDTLPATSFDNSGYNYQCMFRGCSSLAKAPKLPNTALKRYCYSGMFQGCTSLTTAPELLATELSIQCYNGMFSNCTSLTTAPELPAATLVEGCYQSMFSSCSSLSSVKCLATNISATNCTKYWLLDVSSSGTFTKAASMSSWTSGSSGIPSNWTVQDAA